VDILLITFLVYRVYIWIQGTRALRILFALAALGLFYLLASWSGLFITTWILQYLWAVILVVMVVVFQSEIRQVLERMSPLHFFVGQPAAIDRLSLEEVIRAAFELAKKRIGVLIVFQRQDILDDHLKGGIPLDGRVSGEILTSIFLHDSPAHDGAVIIREARIVSVGCYLPLSDNPSLPRVFGTRHRAGIGITERSDALSLIVSEERGEVSLAVDGEIQRVADPDALKARLESMLIKPERKKRYWKVPFTAHLLPKALSLIAVLVLWGLIAKQQRAEMWLSVPLEYRNIPSNKEIVGDLSNKIEIGLRGPRGVISGINPERIRAHIDLAQMVNGLNYIRLTSDNISIPLGTEITKINPPSLKITLESMQKRSLQVRTKLVGKLPGSLKLKSVTVDPAFLMFQGPETVLTQLREVFTEPIDLTAIKENAKISVGIEVYPPQIRLVPNQPSQVSVELQLDRAP